MVTGCVTMGQGAVVTDCVTMGQGAGNGDWLCDHRGKRQW